MWPLNAITDKSPFKRACLLEQVGCFSIFTLSKLRNSGESTCGMEGSLPRLISCHFSPLVGRGSAPEALMTVRAKAKMSAFVKLL